MSRKNWESAFIHAVARNMHTWDEFERYTHKPNGDYVIGSYSLDPQQQRRVLNGEPIEQVLRENGYR